MPISHSGYGRSAPRDDRSYVCKKSGKSATAISTAVVSTATEAGQEQHPDQPSFPPQPLFLLPRSPQLLLPQPLPQPPPQNSKRMIQMQLLPKIPLLQLLLLLQELLLQPQFVAVKSLIFSASTFYLCSIVCGGACQCFRKRLAIIF